MTQVTYSELQQRLSRFADDRDWKSFHTPRNLALALAGEVGELCAEFRWAPDSEVESRLADPSFKEAIASEAADVLTFLIYFADACRIDLLSAAMDKAIVNEDRYPVSLVQGSGAKYDQLPPNSQGES